MISEKNKLESDYMAVSSQLRVTEVRCVLLFLVEIQASGQFENTSYISPLAIQFIVVCN